MYKKYKADNKLVSTVDRYWTLTNSSQENILIDILPDHCFDLIFVMKENRLKNILITGIYSDNQQFEMEAETQLVGVNFYPKSLNNYFTIRLDSLLNKHTTLKPEMLKYPDEFDYEALQDARSALEILELIENYLTRLPIESFELPGYYKNENVEDLAAASFIPLKKSLS